MGSLPESVLLEGSCLRPIATTWRPVTYIKEVVCVCDKPLPVSSSSPPQFPPEQRRLFREVLELMNRSGLPYVVSGAFALHAHTGIWRDTKDLDIFITPENAERALQHLAAAGFDCEVRDPVWLAKAHRADFYVDLITGMSNGVITVDDSWIERGRVEIIMDVSSRVLAAEELIASKLFVTRRERFDGADIAHVIHGTRGNLEWDRLLSLIGDHWEVLLWNLLLFRYCYPMHSDYVPRAVWNDLLGRLQAEIGNGYRKQPFRGSLIDSKMFAIDVEEWGMQDLERMYREQREPKIATCALPLTNTKDEPAA
jgi:hypothetical protein